MRGVASLEEDNLLVFYYLNDTSAIWPDERGASFEEDNLLVFFSILLSRRYIWNLTQFTSILLSWYT